MNLAEIMKWLAEKWEPLEYNADDETIDDDATGVVCEMAHWAADSHGPFLAAAPRNLAELAVELMKQKAGKRFYCEATNCKGHPQGNERAAEELGIDPAHYRKVVEKLGKAKG